MGDWDEESELRVILNEYKTFFPQIELVERNSTSESKSVNTHSLDGQQFNYQLNITTKESRSLIVVVGTAGWTNVSNTFEDMTNHKFFESFESLMMYYSMAFQNNFHRILTSKLELLQQTNNDIESD